VTLSNFGYRKPHFRKCLNFHPAGGSEEWGVHNNSHANIERAIIERVLTVNVGGVQRPPPQPRPGFVKSEMKAFTKRLLHVVRRVSPMTTKEFVDTYRGTKRAMYERTAERLLIDPLSRKDAYIMPFIKDEKTNLTRKDDPCPRIIQPRSARFNVAIGVHLKPMEKPIFRGIATIFGSTTVMKGLNADQRGRAIAKKWGRFTSPFAILLDASRFDQHCSREIIAWEHSIEEAIAIDRTELARLNRMRSRNVCFARTDRGGYKYTLNGVRMSGDMDTAMGNCLTMCAMTYSFMTSIGVSKFEYANDGDDGVLIVEGGDADLVLKSFKCYFLKFGYTMKLEGTSSTLEGIEFCQARPVWDGEGYRLVRDPRVCLGKDSISLKGSTDVDTMLHLRNSVGWCGLSLAGDMPIFNEFYRSMINTSGRPRVDPTTGMQFLAVGMEAKYAQPSDEVRLSFYRAFDIAPDEQLAIETDIRKFHCTIDRPAVLVTRVTNQLYTLQ